MSLYTLPFLYLNLGGEMVYILSQRLKAQKINELKQRKVMADIIKRLLGSSALSTLFTAQPLTTQKRLKANFTKLANSSSINLNESSMSKLYDLMVMTFKYQLLLCKSGHELLLLTLNHLDGLRDLANEEEEHVKLVNNACTQFSECFLAFSEGQLVIAKHTLLVFLQDCNRKVSLFLTKELQLPDGDFVLPHGGKVPYGVQPPGMVHYVYGDQKVEMVTLWCSYSEMEKKGSLDVIGDRVISIGENLYCSDVSSTKVKKKTGKSKENDKTQPDAHSDASAKAELDFLQQLLIGFQQPPPDADDFKLVLFDDTTSPVRSNTTEDSEKPIKKRSSILHNAVQIVKTDSKGHISDVLKDLESVTVSSTAEPSQQKLSTANDEDGNDLLALMDTI